MYDTISMETLLVQENVQNATTIGLATIPTGAPIVVNGVTTPAKGTIAVSSVVIPNLNWNGSSVGGSPIFPVAPIQCGDGQSGLPRILPPAMFWALTAIFVLPTSAPGPSESSIPSPTILPLTLLTWATIARI